MSTKLFPDCTQNGAGTVTADDAASASTAAMRDASADLYARKFQTSGTGNGIRNTGNLYTGISSQTGNFSVNETGNNGKLYLVNGGGSPVTVTLPASSSNSGKVITVKNIDSNASPSYVLIDANGSETIDGALVFGLYKVYDQVTIQCDGSNWQVIGGQPSVIVASVAASTAITAASEGTFDTSGQSLAANTLRVGDVIEFEAQGIVSTYSSGTDTVKLKLGTTVVFSTGAVTPSANDTFHIKGTIQIRTIGASGTFVANGYVSLGTAGTVTAKATFLASTTLDTTAAIALNVTNTFSAASNSARLDLFTVKRFRS